MTQYRRFIAGAVCPSCKEMDKLFMYEAEDKKYRECARCGFKEEINQQGDIKELATRVNQPQQRSSNEQIDVVQIIDIKPPVNAPTESEPTKR